MARAEGVARVGAFARQWKLLMLLLQAERGVMRRRLHAQLKVSRATLYRDLKALEEAGVKIVDEQAGSERRYRVVTSPMSPLTAEQQLALVMARQALFPLRGSHLFSELDGLIRRHAGAPGWFEVGALPAGVEPATLDVLTRALSQRRRLAFDYQAAGDEQPTSKQVEPLLLYVKSEQVYLDAHDLTRGAVRTFKVARMARAQVLAEAAREHRDYDAARVRAAAVKVWDAPAVEVRVRLAADKARFVREWPLRADQLVEQLADGAVIVSATVAGTLEALKWVLGWGAGATVLAPVELREAHKAELRGALEGYERPVSPDETSAQGGTKRGARASVKKGGER